MIIENFDDFYDHYQGFSAYVAFCITEDYELSKDISQEVFLALFKVKEKLDYSRPGRLKALVMKATSNKCMDYYRKASSRQESYTIDDEENAYEPVDEKSNPEARILRMEEEKYQKLVLNRLRKRNPMNYDILVKTKFQELSAAEVASEYGITPNNVNNRNLRSKAWIIEEMERYAGSHIDNCLHPAICLFF